VPLWDGRWIGTSTTIVGRSCRSGDPTGQISGQSGETCDKCGRESGVDHLGHIELHQLPVLEDPDLIGQGERLGLVATLARGEPLGPLVEEPAEKWRSPRNRPPGRSPQVVGYANVWFRPFSLRG
jgi:hypothetical protein